MTVVFIDPIHGAALTAGLLPILPGLPCPTCGGRSEFRDDMFGSSPCPDCTDGVWTPPEHPVPIGVTSALPEEWAQFGDFTVRAQWPGSDGWALDNCMGGDLARIYQITPSSVIGEARLRKVPVVDGERLDQDLTPELVCLDRHGLSHYRPLLSNRRDISSALPFFPNLKPGDTVYLLEGFTRAWSAPSGTTRHPRTSSTKWSDD